MEFPLKIKKKTNEWILSKILLNYKHLKSLNKINAS